MTALPDASTAVSPAATEADLKNYLVGLHDYLFEMFGDATTVSAFLSGTKLVFPQATAPTGWTKSTAHDNKAMRIVSGSTGGYSYGSVAFSTVFGRTASDASSLSIAQLASHTHGLPRFTESGSTYGTIGSDQNNTLPPMDVLSKSTGSGSTHSHGLDLRVQYVDVIIATKD